MGRLGCAFRLPPVMRHVSQLEIKEIDESKEEKSSGQQEEKSMTG